jgi:curved DNA-binding protein CbpA
MTDDHIKSYYDLLEINKDASQDEIRKAYIRLARMYHPDHNANPSDRHMILLNQVYEVLSNPSKKSEYDKRFTSETALDFTHNKEEPVKTEVHERHYSVRQENAWRKFKQWYPAILVVLLSYIFIFLLVNVIRIFITLPSWTRYIIP